MYKDNTFGGVCQEVDGRDFGSLDNISTRRVKNYGPHYGHQLDNPLDGGDRPSVFREPQLWSDTDGGNHCPSSFSYI